LSQLTLYYRDNIVHFTEHIILIYIFRKVFQSCYGILIDLVNITDVDMLP
jgi:hypothetical protein